MKQLKFTLFMLVILGGAFSIATKPAELSTGTGYEVGDEVADFKLKNIDDKMVSLSDNKTAKGFIVIFTCNHCPYSKAYEDRIIALDAMYKSKGYPVIAINPNDSIQEPDDSFDKMKERAKEKGFTFPYLVDADQSIYPAFGASRTPHVYVVNKKDAKFYVEYIGAIDNNTKEADKADKHYVQDAVNALLEGKKPAVPFTKAIGCSIKKKQN
ncbi:MAG: thioredoxin family protein [Bacteroidetes bacterium]|nr:MAG: thioredoxin family protein [Bacteroidota bacterium]